MELGKILLSMPMFVAAIEDDCILGVDFLATTNVKSNMRTVLGLKALGNSEKKFSCAHINYFTRVPDFLLELYEQNSKILNLEQKEKFAKLFLSFKMYFPKILLLEIVRSRSIRLN